MAGPSPAARLKTTATAACATHLSRRERVRVHIPNEAGGSQAACVSTLRWPPLFTGAGVATATSTGWHNRGGLLPMYTPPPLPCPLTSHTICPSCLALTSLGLHCQLLLLLLRWQGGRGGLLLWGGRWGTGGQRGERGSGWRRWRGRRRTEGGTRPTPVLVTAWPGALGFTGSCMQGIIAGSEVLEQFSARTSHQPVWLGADSSLFAVPGVVCLNNMNKRERYTQKAWGWKRGRRKREKNRKSVQLWCCLCTQQCEHILPIILITRSRNSSCEFCMLVVGGKQLSVLWETAMCRAPEPEESLKKMNSLKESRVNICGRSACDV